MYSLTGILLGLPDYDEQWIQRWDVHIHSSGTTKKKVLIKMGRIDKLGYPWLE